MKEDILMYEYEQLLLGKRSNLAKNYFLGTKESAQKTALRFVQMAIEDFLHWTPKQASVYLTRDIAERMKLDKIIQYVEYPGELTPEEDYFYLVHLLYPYQVKYDMEEMTIRTYKNILDKNNTKNKFSKEYMSGPDGHIRACICLQYMINNFLMFTSLKSIYAYFATSKGINALRKYKLYLVYYTIYDTPIDYLYEMFTDSQKNEAYYNYYKFLYLDKIARKNALSPSSDEYTELND